MVCGISAKIHLLRGFAEYLVKHSETVNSIVKCRFGTSTQAYGLIRRKMPIKDPNLVVAQVDASANLSQEPNRSKELCA